VNLYIYYKFNPSNYISNLSIAKIYFNTLKGTFFLFDRFLKSESCNSVFLMPLKELKYTQIKGRFKKMFLCYTVKEKISLNIIFRDAPDIWKVSGIRYYPVLFYTNIRPDSRISLVSGNISGWNLISSLIFFLYKYVLEINMHIHDVIISYTILFSIGSFFLEDTFSDIRKSLKILDIRLKEIAFLNIRSDIVYLMLHSVWISDIRYPVIK